MKGHVFLKVTGILMIIAAAFSIIVGVFSPESVHLLRGWVRPPD